MVAEVDLVMWAKNGSRTLPDVLKTINEVIPAGSVSKRIIIDDNSVDNTRSIGSSFGWEIKPNQGKGISDAANTALKYVESNYFISFEQDLVLARDWWEKIPPLMQDFRVAVASGVRLPNKPIGLKKVQEYITERYEKATDSMSFFYGKTLDNTIYRTDVIRELGGFPKLSVSAGIDTVLAQHIQANDYKWKVNFRVKSTHLRQSLTDELRHYYWYGTCASGLARAISNRDIDLSKLITRLLFSPARAFEIAVKKGSPDALYIYPLIRFMILKGALDGRL